MKMRTSFKRDGHTQPNNQRRLFCAIVILILTCSHIQSIYAEDEIVIGDVAPALNLEKLLQAPTNASADFKRLKGKVVLIEFWATWCGPCVAAFEGMNALAKTLESQPVVFISITDEGEGFIRKFLKSHPLQSWIGLDTDRSAFKDYGVVGIPHTIIVDRNSRIVAITHPGYVSEQVIRDVLDGKEISLPKKSSGPAFATVKMTAQELSHAQFTRPVEGENSAFEFDGKHIFMRGNPFGELLPWAYESLSWRTLDKSHMSNQIWTFSASIPHENPRNHKQLFKLWQASIEATFGLSAQMRMVDSEVLVMTCHELSGTAIKNSQLDHRIAVGRQRNGIRTGQGDLTRDIASNFELVLGIPVVDETNLSGRYDYQLRYDDDNTETIIENVRQQLGFVLKRARRKVEMLVIEPSSD